MIIDSGKFDWESLREIPVPHRAQPLLPRRALYPGSGGRCFVTKIRAVLLRDTGASLSPLPRFRLPARARNPLPACGTPCGKYPQGGGLPAKASKGCQGEPSILPDNPSYPLYQKYFPNGGASIFTIEVQGEKKKPKPHRSSPAVLPLANVPTPNRW